MRSLCGVGRTPAAPGHRQHRRVPHCSSYPDFALQYSPVTEKHVPERTAVYRRESGQSQRYHARLQDISYVSRAGKETAC